MSTDYSLYCKAHNESVSVCSDGLSGPMLQCDKSLAMFVITHRNCELTVFDEGSDLGESSLEWGKSNRSGLFSYDKVNIPANEDMDEEDFSLDDHIEKMDKILVEGIVAKLTKGNRP